MTPHRITLTFLLLATLGPSGPAAARDPGPDNPRDPAPRRDYNPRRTPVVEVVEKSRAAVVNIHSERTVRGPATEDFLAMSPSPNRVNGMGTGILIDPRGYVVTNQHVVEDVNLIRVRLSDGTAHGARVLARSQESDLALLKIDVGRPLPTIALGTAQDLLVGETVIAMGNAYGYEHTVTVGVVSAIKRDVTLNKDIAYKSLIQTDASINPGNSGGPLLNIHGELIGVNVAIRAGAQGIGFAIPVDSAIRVAADMIASSKRTGINHGLVCRDSVCCEAGTCARRSLVVERSEPNGPADKAGLQRGDVIVQVGDLKVACGLDLERALLDVPTGEKVPVVVRRRDEEKKAELVLFPLEHAAAKPLELVWNKLGLRLTPATPDQVARTNQQLHGGLLVTEVRPDGAAARAGIQRGDILIGLHQWEMLSLHNVAFVLTHPDLPNFNPLRFFIIRSGMVHRGWVPQVE